MKSNITTTPSMNGYKVRRFAQDSYQVFNPRGLLVYSGLSFTEACRRATELGHKEQS
jgi:hypothetical protein